MKKLVETEGDVSEKIDRRRLLQTACGLGGIYISASRPTAAAVSNAVQSTGGDTLWEFEIGGSVKSSPTVAGGTVFVGGYDGSMYALDTESGDQQWSFETDSRGFWASPIVVDDSVCIGSLDGTLYLLDAASGDVRWSVETDGNFLSSPVVADGTIFGINWSEHVFAFDTESSEMQWTLGLPQQVNSSLTVADGTVFFGTADNSLYAVDAETGSQQWQFETGGRVRSSPTVADGTVFVGSNDTNLYALNANTGELQWVFETDGQIGISSPTVADRTVFLGSGDSHLYAVDAVTGEQQWAFETDDGVASSPTVANGTVFVGSNDNNLYAVDAATGSRLWSIETGDSVYSSPTVVDGTVFVGSDDATVYAIDAGIKGSSEGSRTRLGTLGHHDGWRYATQSISAETDSNVELSLDVPDEAPPEWSVAIEATAENTGGEDDQYGAALRIDGSVVDSVGSIAAGEIATLSTTVETGAEGESHVVVVESRDGSQQIEQRVIVTDDAAIDIQYDHLFEDRLLPITQSEDAVISGITTADPRSDAEIRIRATESSVSFDRRKQVSVGEDGSIETRFDTSTLEAGTELETQFWVAGDRIDSIGSFVVETASSPESQTLAVELSATTVQANERTDLTVTVMDADTGKAVEGATVELPSLQASSATTATGEATLTITPTSPETHLIEVTADGFDSAERTLTVEPAADGVDDVERSDGSTADDTVSVEVPGFGIGETLAAVGAVGYALRRRLTDTD